MTNTDTLLADLETACQEIATKNGWTIEEARFGMRLHLARAAASFGKLETANAYCAQWDLPIRFEQHGEKVAMIDA